MEILIEEKVCKDDFKHITLACGKVRASIYFPSWGGVRVTNLNSSHQAFRGAGRGFMNVSAALEGYKSSKMQAMIQFAVQELQTIETV